VLHVKAVCSLLGSGSNLQRERAAAEAGTPGVSQASSQGQGKGPEGSSSKGQDRVAEGLSSKGQDTGAEEFRSKEEYRGAEGSSSKTQSVGTDRLSPETAPIVLTTPNPASPKGVKTPVHPFFTIQKGLTAAAVMGASGGAAWYVGGLLARRLTAAIVTIPSPSACAFTVTLLLAAAAPLSACAVWAEALLTPPRQVGLGNTFEGSFHPLLGGGTSVARRTHSAPQTLNPLSTTPEQTLFWCILSTLTVHCGSPAVGLCHPAPGPGAVFSPRVPLVLRYSGGYLCCGVPSVWVCVDGSVSSLGGGCCLAYPRGSPRHPCDSWPFQPFLNNHIHTRWYMQLSPQGLSVYWAVVAAWRTLRGRHPGGYLWCGVPSVLGLYGRPFSFTGQWLTLGGAIRHPSDS